MNKMLLCLSALLFLLRLVLPLSLSVAEVFLFLNTVLRKNTEIRRILNSFVFCFKNGFLHVKPSNKSITACMKNRAYNNFNLLSMIEGDTQLLC